MIHELNVSHCFIVFQGSWSSKFPQLNKDQAMRPASSQKNFEPQH